MVDLRHGDCLDVLRSLPDASVDAVVTDPPYGLAFMGKKWDYDVPSVEIWAECLRVLKPGGHLLAFAGTRTQHRMAVRIEDAGFEIRDMIAWVYGSGFPKSLDVSKAIDRMDASEEQELRRLRFTAWVRGTGATSRQIDEATGTNMGGHYTTAASQPAIMTREHLEQCRNLLGDVPEWVEREADIRSVESRNMAKREVVGSFRSSLGGTVAAGERNADYIATHKERTVPLTAPATDAARQWQGWGTALKPAMEMITVARKPLAGTVAETVLAYGTGALNIHGCRVGVTDAAYARNCSGDRGHAGTRGVESEGATNIHAGGGGAHDAGRWPANLIHDGSDEVVGLFPQSTSGANPTRRGGMGYHGAEGQESCDAPRGAESGSAARFFQCCNDSACLQREGGYNATDPKPEHLCHEPHPPQSSAPTAASSSSLRNAAEFTVRSVAATWGSHAVTVSSDTTAPSTNVTPTECASIVEACTVTMLSIASGCWPELRHERRTPSGSLASAVATRSPIGITTITASLSKSDGSAEHVTFSITPDCLALGAAGSRFRYCAKASKRDRDEGLEGFAEVASRQYRTGNVHNGHGGRVPDKLARNNHPTVKPTDLMRYLCRLVTPPGGLVLDPFMGSGSTGKAAVLEGFRFIGIEREAEYVEIARARIEAVTPATEEPTKAPARDDAQLSLWDAP